MSGMFNNAASFNQPLGTWITSSVTNMSNMFGGATNFNQNISFWDVSSVTNMSGMFLNATVFEQDLGSWDVSNVTSMIDMFGNISLSVTNYDALLVGWAALPSLQPNVQFNAGNSFYSAFPSAASVARNTLTSAPNNWIITDSGPV
jgi:surface protein